MNTMALATRAILCGVLSVGLATATACSDHGASDAQAVGTITIPLLATVGTNIYRLEAVFAISGAQGTTTLATNGDEPVLTTTLPAGAYNALLESFTLFKKDGSGTFRAVPATVVSDNQDFTIFAHSTTSISFLFETQDEAVAIGSGDVNITFGVNEVPAPCTVLGPGCPDGSWCPPSALTGQAVGCFPAGTVPVGSACTSPLDCVASSTCHDFGDGPVCAPLCEPSEFGTSCAAGGACVEADPSFGLCTPEGACNPLTVDRHARTVRSARFFLDFSNRLADNPEEVDVLQWAGGPNLVQSFAHDSCSSGVVEYFGNSWAPPDPQSGGQVLVGSGTTGSWEQDGASIVIRSKSSGCAQSMSVPVETRYSFREGLGADTLEVERRFDLDSTTRHRTFRPFMPRLTVAFDRVLHPDASGTTLVSENVFACPYGCALKNWDGSWFAYYASSGPFAGQGMIARRDPSATPATVWLWIDNDAGITDTNASGVLLEPPASGFPEQITEKELLCFFDADSWTPSDQAALALPPGCTLDLACDAGEPPSPCDPNPCQHDGTCRPASGGYTCSCPSSVTGKDCETVFTDVQVGQGFSCGLRNDGQILCWGAGYGGTAAPSGTFGTLSAGGLAACGLRTDGTLACWGYSNQGILSPPGGTFETIAATSDYACATHNHVATCWGSFAQFDFPPSDAFSAIEIGAWHSCGIRLDGTVACWGLHNSPNLDFGQADPPGGPFRALSLTTEESCGLRLDDSRLECWGTDVFGGAPLPTAPLQAFDISSNGCAIGMDGRLTCWGAYSPPPPDGTFRAVAVSGAHSCAIGTDYRLSCWGQNGAGESTPPY